MRMYSKIRAKYGMKVPKLYFGGNPFAPNSPFANTTMSQNITGGNSGVGSNQPNTVNPNVGTAIGMGASMLGTALSPLTIDEETGKRNEWGAAGTQALQMGGTGAGIGTMIMPGLGTAIGAGIGVLAGGTMGYFTSKNNNDIIDERNEKRDKLFADAKAEQEKQRNNAVLSTYDAHGLNTVYNTRYGGRIGRIGVAKNGAYIPKDTTITSKPLGKFETIDSQVGQDIVDRIVAANPNVRESTIRGIFDSETGNKYMVSADGNYIGRGQISKANLKARGIPEDKWNDDYTTANESIKLFGEYLTKHKGDELAALKAYQGVKTEAGMKYLNKKLGEIDKYRKPTTMLKTDYPESEPEIESKKTLNNMKSAFNNSIKLAKGGKLANGINVQNANKLSNQAVVVDGATHEQGGEIVTQGQNPVAEVENQEVVRQAADGGTQVYSDELGFAKVAEQIEAKKGMLQSQLGIINRGINELLSKVNTEPDTFKKNGAKRKLDQMKEQAEVYVQGIQQLNQQAEQLFAQQEQMKQQQGIENQPVEEGKYGMKLPKAENGTFIDRGEYTPYTTRRDPSDSLYKTPTNRFDSLLNNIGLRNENLWVDNNTLSTIPTNDTSSFLFKDEQSNTNKNLSNLSIEDLRKLKEQSIADVNAERLSDEQVPSDSFDNIKAKGKSMLSSAKNRLANVNSDNIREIGTSASLFADNVANYIINEKMTQPDAYVPQTYNAVQLNTTHNIEPTLKKIDDTRRRYSRLFNISSPNSTYAAAKMSMIEDKLQDSTGRIMTEKQNIETERKNKMNLLNAQIDQANIDNLNNAKLREIDNTFNFKMGKLGRMSQNISNVAGDVAHIIERGDKRRFEKDYLDMLGKANPVFASEYADKLITGLTSERDAQELYNAIKQTHGDSSAVLKKYRDGIAKRNANWKIS